MAKQHKLEILLAWLEDNVECGTDIEFIDGVDSAAMIPEIRAAVELLKMPKAGRNKECWGDYFYTSAMPSLEMNRAESQVWNAAREYVIDSLNCRTAQESE